MKKYLDLKDAENKQSDLALFNRKYWEKLSLKIYKSNFCFIL